MEMPGRVRQRPKRIIDGSGDHRFKRLLATASLEPSKHRRMYKRHPQHRTSNIRSRPHTAVRIVAILLVAIACAYVGAGWYLWANQRALIFFPSSDVRQSPADVGLKYEEVWVPVLGGQPI